VLAAYVPAPFHSGTAPKVAAKPSTQEIGRKLDLGPKPPSVPAPRFSYAAKSIALQLARQQLSPTRTPAVGAKKRKLIDQPVKNVHVVSVGWNQQGVKYSPNLHDLVSGEDGLIQKLKFGGIPEPHVTIDCRVFKSRNCRKVLGHTGYHAVIIKETVLHHLFSDTMRKAIDDIVRAVDEDIVVMCVCTSGCHRSVAVSVILKMILEKMLYSVKLHHFSSGSWAAKRLCTSCDFCDDDNELKLNMFQVALEQLDM
jgi:hypothetical protein